MTKKKPKPAQAPEPSEEPSSEEVEAEPVGPRERSGAGRTYDMPSDVPPPPPPGTIEGSTGWAMACHLSALLTFGVSVFLIGLLAPLVIWLIFKDRDGYIDHHGKESVNFQLNMLFWYLVALALSCIVIGIPLLFVLPVVDIVFVIIAAVAAANGQRYRYPFILRVIE